jgi:hypothetical protein
MVAYLRTNESRWVGKEIIETAGLLEEAKSLASLLWFSFSLSWVIIKLSIA